MLPSHYFEVICCPYCRGDLAGDDTLSCTKCGKTFPVVDGVPVLIAGSEDEVSRSVASFYENAWKRNETGELTAKQFHEDVTVYGQRYIEEAERRFEDVFRRDDSPRFFLDAACGAQPRTVYGRSFRYHVCLDFSIDGLVESRRLLGDRAVCICGSLLQMPLKDKLFEGVLASHCLYHIGQDRQAEAVGELLRVLAPGGTLLILYGNPQWRNFLSRMLHNYRVLKRRIRRRPATGRSEIFTFLHPIEWMKEKLSANNGVEVSVEPLCAFTREETEPIFRKPVLGGIWYALIHGLDSRWKNRPERCYYIAYRAKRPANA